MSQTKPAHSTRGASGAHRWMKCHGQPQLVEQLIRENKIPEEDEGNEHTKRGTAAHHVVEQCLVHKLDPEIFEGREILGVEIDAEDIEAVKVFLNYVDELRVFMGPDVGMFVECRFELQSLHPTLFGTADVVLFTPDFTQLKVIDYKHGVGVPVTEKGNPQLLYYALGAIKQVCPTGKNYLKLFDFGRVFDEVEVIVVQPRCNHPDGPIRSWAPTANEIDDFADDLVWAADKTMEPGAALEPGEHCHWCRAAPWCKAKEELKSIALRTEFEGVSDPVNLNFPLPETLTPADLSKMMRFAPMIKDFLKSAEETVLYLLKQGKKVPGFKLVKKKARRQWKEEAEKKLRIVGENQWIYEDKKLKSPAQMEKVIDKKIVADLAYKPDTGTTVAPDYDNRPAVSLGPAIEFKD